MKNSETSDEKGGYLYVEETIMKNVCKKISLVILFCIITGCSAGYNHNYVDKKSETLTITQDYGLSESYDREGTLLKREIKPPTYHWDGGSLKVSDKTVVARVMSFFGLGGPEALTHKKSDLFLPPEPRKDISLDGVIVYEEKEGLKQSLEGQDWLSMTYTKIKDWAGILGIIGLGIAAVGIVIMIFSPTSITSLLVKIPSLWRSIKNLFSKKEEEKEEENNDG